MRTFRVLSALLLDLLFIVERFLTRERKSNGPNHCRAPSKPPERRTRNAVEPLVATTE